MKTTTRMMPVFRGENVPVKNMDRKTVNGMIKQVKKSWMFKKPDFVDEVSAYLKRLESFRDELPEDN